MINDATVIEVTKKFRFEAAHRLGDGYKGKCTNLHGHSWNGSVTVCSLEKGTQLDGFGMVVDYAKIKEIIKPTIDFLDHSVIVGVNDTSLRDFAESEENKVYLINGNPTSESIAMHLYAKWQPLFADAGLLLVSVKICETCTTKCTVY